ncbi:MAG TPA: hypothetical protein VJU17_08515, partial [Gemmatimonadales bacterium]|nr:hypothetical protein [Gemmatimonadales bacterium]
ALPIEPLDPEETPRGIALAALKEIDFDRETGKLSETDYEYLKSKYTRAALDALRTESGPASVGSAGPSSQPSLHVLPPIPAQEPRCEVCGLRPEPDALYCSSCGRRLAPAPAMDGIPLPHSPRTASA